MAALSLLLAATAMLLLRSGGPRLAGPDRPAGDQLPLATTITTHDPTGGPSYDIALPAAPEAGSVAASPASDGSVSFGGVPLGGSKFGALLLVKGGTGWSSSPRKALEEEADRGKSHGLLTPVGPIRSTLVGNTPAYALDFVMRSGKHLREFRFSHDGALYSAGIVYYAGDSISLDTALAALRTLHWHD